MNTLLVLAAIIFMSLSASADLKSAQSAAAEGRLETLKAEIKKNSKLVNRPDENGDTLLLIAVASEKEAAVNEILRHRPNLELKNKDQFSALDLALTTGNEAIALKLLKAGAKTQSAQLLLAAEKNMAAVISVLSKHKTMDINHQDDDGNSALHLAARSGSQDAVKALLAAGAKSGLKNKKSQTARDLAHENKQSQTETLFK